MKKRILGKSGIEVTALGLGTARLSGKGWKGIKGNVIDFGPVDDKESIETLRLSIDMGINVFDTSVIYGAGHNERLVGKAIEGKRDKAVIVSKAGWYIDEEKRTIEKPIIDNDPRDVKKLCEDSLRRLRTDYIDVYLFHTSYKDDKIDLEKAAQVRDCMEELVNEGKIRWHGWSTDWPHQLEVFMKGKHCVCTEMDLNIFDGNEETLKLCEDNNLASLNRRILAGGALTSKPRPEGKKNQYLDEKDEKKFEAIKEIITSDGRSVVQGAIGWLWSRSEVNIPIAGFRTKEQALDCIGALEYGPLTLEQMEEIEKIKNEV